MFNVSRLLTILEQEHEAHGERFIGIQTHAFLERLNQSDYRRVEFGDHTVTRREILWEDIQRCIALGYIREHGFLKLTSEGYDRIHSPIGWLGGIYRENKDPLGIVSIFVTCFITSGIFLFAIGLFATFLTFLRGLL